MSDSALHANFSSEDLSDLCRAKTLLEHSGLTARLANAIGAPIEKGLQKLPPRWSETLQRAAQQALTSALDLAIDTLDPDDRSPASERWHQWLVGASGSVGGALGLPALLVELPLSTAIMLRSIADIARSEGLELRRPEIRLSCLEVFALGGPNPAVDNLDNGYWVVRAALTQVLNDAAACLAQRGGLTPGTSALARFIGAVAARFGALLSDQIAAKTIPIVGAAAGAAVNVAFLDHFQIVSRGHFIVRRLEDRYGGEAVQMIYRSIPQRLTGSGV